MTQAAAITVPQAGERSHWLVLALVLTGTFLTVFDNFVVNVALPTIQRDLGATFAQVQFVVAGYALTYAVTLITGGRLGDVFGHRRLFLVGLGGFTAMSVLCGVAPTPATLIGARLLQGATAALLSPQVLSLIQVTFPPPQRARAFGTFGAVAGIAGLAGQVVGGVLVQANLFGLSWRPIFLLNLPIGLLVLLLGRSRLPESRSATAPRLDLGGVALLTLALTLLSLPLIAGREAGWPPWAWACLAATVPALGLFLGYERRQEVRRAAPLVALHIFRERTFVAGLLITLLFSANSSGFFFALALLLQVGLNLASAAAGLVLGPAAIGYFVGATSSAAIARRIGNRAIVLGLVLDGLGFLVSIGLVALRPEAPPLVLFVAIVIISSAGAGLTSPLLIGAILAGIARDDAGSASGVLLTAQQIVGALGVALIGLAFFCTLTAQAPAISASVSTTLDPPPAPPPATSSACPPVARSRPTRPRRASSPTSSPARRRATTPMLT